MIVIDASALLEILKQTDLGFELAETLVGRVVHAPYVIDLEVTQALRRLTLHGNITLAQAEWALDLFSDMPIVRHVHMPMLREIWAMRHNLSAYDASYLALAQSLGAPLITQDGALRKMAARGRPN
jgi:predicted nucleic acid-binding protein